MKLVSTGPIDLSTYPNAGAAYPAIYAQFAGGPSVDLTPGKRGIGDVVSAIASASTLDVCEDCDAEITVDGVAETRSYDIYAIYPETDWSVGVTLDGEALSDSETLSADLMRDDALVGVLDLPIDGEFRPETSDDVFKYIARTVLSDLQLSGEGDIGGGAGDNAIRGGGGRLDGRFGDDRITLAQTEDETGEVYGGPGKDAIFAEGGSSFIHGGADEDIIAVLSGRHRVIGGEDEDLFIFAAPTSTAAPDASAPATAWAALVDFEVGVDALVFDDDGVISEGGGVSLADLFDVATLGELDRVVEIGEATYYFNENGRGDAFMRRVITGEDGEERREKVVFEGKSLEDVSAADIYIDADLG